MTNLVPNYYEVDNFQVRTPTDILGQHIHLVKFDVTSSDGAGNGWGAVELWAALADGRFVDFLLRANAQDKWPFGFSLLMLPFVAAASLSAQGTTTGAVTGSVTTQTGQAVEAAGSGGTGPATAGAPAHRRQATAAAGRASRAAARSPRRAPSGSPPA